MTPLFLKVMEWQKIMHGYFAQFLKTLRLSTNQTTTQNNIVSTQSFLPKDTTFRGIISLL